MAARMPSCWLAALAALAIAFAGAGCGGDDEETTTAAPATGATGAGGDEISEAERARKLGNLVEKAQRQEARQTQKNLESGGDCGPGESYNPQLGICLELP